MSESIFMSFSYYCGTIAFLLIFFVIGMRITKCCQDKIKRVRNKKFKYKLMVHPNGYEEEDIDIVFSSMETAINLGKEKLSAYWGGFFVIYLNGTCHYRHIRMIIKEGNDWVDGDQK